MSQGQAAILLYCFTAGEWYYLNVGLQKAMT